MEWENVVVNPTSDKGLICRIYKELPNLNKKNKDSKMSKTLE